MANLKTFYEISSQIYFSLLRLVIDTPELFEKLKKGEIGSGYLEIIVKAGAHPQVLLQPKYFSNASYPGMHFYDEHDNRISIYTRSRIAYGYFKVGQGLSLGMPAVYADYELRFDGESIVTTDDINYIFQWKNTRFLKVFDKQNAPIEIMGRIEEFSGNLKGLISIAFNVQPHSYKQLRVRPLIDKFVELGIAHFMAEALSADQIKEFVAYQELPSGWVVEVNNGNWIVFTH